MRAWGQPLRIDDETGRSHTPPPAVGTDAEGGLHFFWVDDAPPATRFAHFDPTSGAWLNGERHVPNVAGFRILRDETNITLLLKGAYWSRWTRTPASWSEPQAIDSIREYAVPVESRHGVAVIEYPSVEIYRPESNSWSPPSAPADAEIMKAWPPAYFMGSGKHVAAAWVRGEIIPKMITEVVGIGVFARWFDADAGAWSAIETISTSRSARDPSVAIDGDGDAHVLWLEDGSPGLEVRARRRSWTTGLWTPSETLSSGEPGGAASVVTVDHDGDVHALTTMYQGGSWAFTMQRFDRQTDTWSISREAGTGRSMSLVMTGRNDHAMAVWNGATGLVTWRLDPASGEWSPVTPAGVMVQNLSLTRIAVGSTGAAALLWVEPNGSGTPLLVSVFDPVAQAWTTPVAMQTPDNQLPVSAHQAAIDDAGNVSVLWSEGDTQTAGSRVSLWTSRWACRQ